MTPLTVLILDRREDCVTPLLNQWTYQAMIHELLGFENNRVDLGKGATEDQNEIAMSTLSDPFYQENLYNNFGDLGASTTN